MLEPSEWPYWKRREKDGRLLWAPTDRVQDAILWFGAQREEDIVLARQRWYDATDRSEAGRPWKVRVEVETDFVICTTEGDVRVDRAYLVDGAPFALEHEGESSESARELLSRVIEGAPALRVTTLWLIARKGIGVEARAVRGEPRWFTVPVSLTILALIDLLAEQWPIHTRGVVEIPTMVLAAQICQRAIEERGRALVSTPHVETLALLVDAALRAYGRRGIVISTDPPALGRLADTLGVDSPHGHSAYPLGTAGRCTDVLVFCHADAGLGGEHGWRKRAQFPDASLIAITSLPPPVIDYRLRHAFGDPRDSDGLLSEYTPSPRGIRVHSTRWTVDPRRFRTPDREDKPWDDATDPAFFWAHQVARERGPTLVLVPRGAAASVVAWMTAEGAPALDGSERANESLGWRMLSEDEEHIFVVLENYPWEAHGVPLRRVVLLRELTPKMMARLLHALRTERIQTPGAAGDAGQGGAPMRGAGTARPPAGTSLFSEVGGAAVEPASTSEAEREDESILYLSSIESSEPDSLLLPIDTHASVWGPTRRS